MKQNEVVEGMREERERLIAFLEGLSPEEWEKPSLCEGWRVRDVAAHLVGNAADILAQNLEDAGSPAYNQRQVDERAGATPAQILDEWRSKGPEVEEFFGSFAPEIWDAPLPPWGTVGFGVQRILEDLWVHAQDIRGPLGAEIVPGSGVRAALEILARELPERLGRLAPSVGSVEISAGDFAERVEAGDGEAIRVEGAPEMVALAATGRRALEGDAVKVTPAVPAGFADAFNFYGP